VSAAGVCRNCGQAPVFTGTAAGEATPEHPDGLYDLAEDGLCEACWDDAQAEVGRLLADDGPEGAA
jgi:hypothetical protein